MVRRLVKGRSCRDRGMVLVASALLASTVALDAPAVANSEIIEVHQIDLTFVPSSVKAAPGSTVRFIWTSGVHTVTSGMNCGLNGLFNAPLNATNPVFNYVVPVGAPELIPFLCLPHCVGMTGAIQVVDEKAPACSADLDGSGEVDFTDLLALLSAWGPCGSECEEDLTGSGEVGFADLLFLLNNWGPC